MATQQHAASSSGTAHGGESSAKGSDQASSIILIAVDRSQQAEQAFDWYIKSLHRPSNHLLLIHVPEGPNIESSKGIRLSEGEYQKMLENEKKETAEMTEKYQKKLDALKVKATYKTVYGKPGEAIVEAAKHDNATAIVMGTRGMGTVRRTIMGSVSDYVVHHSHVPVIVCRN